MSDSKLPKLELSRQEIIAVYHQGPEKVIELVENLIRFFNSHLTSQTEVISQLQSRVQALEDQLSKNSRNSSKPPSSDSFKKSTTSSGKQIQQKVGGQPGHKGHTLKFSSLPDEVILYPINDCSHCGHSLLTTEVMCLERRQVFDIPPVKIRVIEHQAESRLCPCCGTVNKAKFPKEVKAPVQYGNRLKGLAIYLTYYQLLPYERCKEFFGDLFGHFPGVASIMGAAKACQEPLKEVIEHIRQLLISSPVMHNDETGYRINKVRQWLHVASTAYLTLYYSHAKRGKIALDAMNVLSDYKGTSVHDFYQSYYQYDCCHSLCNAHHLRELIFLYEQKDQQWAKSMMKLLLEIKAVVDETKPQANELSNQQIQTFENQYQLIISSGLRECRVKSPPAKQPSSKRGRKKQSKAKNLLDRFQKHQNQVLAFMYDFQIPFDNNQAERDLRMMKVQQKISGCFRTQEGADMFCLIRSYISTARKQGINAINAIHMALDGKPFLPKLIPE